jgi:hypothetical protein
MNAQIVIFKGVKGEVGRNRWRERGNEPNGNSGVET